MFRFSRSLISLSNLNVVKNNSVKLASVINYNNFSTVAKEDNVITKPIIELDYRTLVKTKKIRKLRDVEKLIPGLLYGKDNEGNQLKILVQIDTKQLNRLIRTYGRSLETIVFDLKFPDGRSYLASPRQLQECPLNEEPLSVNYFIYHPGQIMKIPINYINHQQSIDIRRGSYLRRATKFVDVVCEVGVDVPTVLNIDLTGREKGQVMRLDDVIFPTGVKPAKHVPLDLVISKISAKRGKA